MILDVDAKSRQLFMSYLYWGDQWNEWVHIESGRIAPFGSQTYQVAGVAACLESARGGGRGEGWQGRGWGALQRRTNLIPRVFVT